MNPGSLATDRLATWLDARADRLTPTLGEFSRCKAPAVCVKPRSNPLDKVSRAWLITGTNGLSIAKRLLDKSFGCFSDGADPDHLGLMLQIGNYVILEMNQNGSTLFWNAGDKEMPGFFQPRYNRRKLIHMCPLHLTETDVGRFRLYHNSGWTFKYESAIRTWTGVSHSR